MLYLINKHYGNYNENTQYVLYDDKKNEINSYTGTQIKTKVTKGVEIQGIYVNNSFVEYSMCRIQNLPGIVSCINADLYDNSKISTSYTNFILLYKPIKLNKIKTGMVFIYKNVKMMYVAGKPVDTSYWVVDYFNGLIDNNTLKDNSKYNNINIEEYLKNIFELSNYINRKIKVNFDLMRLNIKLKYLDFNLLSGLTENHFVSYKLRSENNVKYVNVGNHNITRVNFMDLTGYLKSQDSVVIDFSDCYSDYPPNKYIGCSSYDDFGYPASPDNNVNITFLFNDKQPEFVTNYVKKAKLICLGYLPFNLPKQQRYAAVEQLKAKNVLMKNIDINKNKHYYVLMK